MIDYSASELEAIRRKFRNERIRGMVEYVSSVIAIVTLFVVIIILWETFL
jgi:hypothetical protein